MHFVVPLDNNPLVFVGFPFLVSGGNKIGDKKKSRDSTWDGGK